MASFVFSSPCSKGGGLSSACPFELPSSIHPSTARNKARRLAAPAHTPWLLLAFLVASAVVHTSTALTIIIENGSYTAAALNMGTLPANDPGHTLIVRNSVFTGTLVDLTSVETFIVEDSHFTDVALTVVMRADNTDTGANAARQFIFQRNTFVHSNPSGPLHASAETLDINIEAFASGAAVAASLTAFAFNEVSVGVSACAATLLSQVNDRSTVVGHTRCHDRGATIACGTATTALIINKYNAGTSNDACLTTDVSARYILRKQNNINGDVDPSTPLVTSDIYYCAPANVGVNDDCSGLSASFGSNVNIGRYFSSSSAFNPATGLMDFTLLVEDYHNEAVSIWTKLADDSLTCPSRTLAINTATNKFAGNNRREATAANFWTSSASTPLTLNQGTALEKTISVFEFKFSIGARSACAVTTAEGRSELEFVVRHEASSPEFGEYTTAETESHHSVFFILDAIIAVNLGSTVANDIFIFPDQVEVYPPLLTPTELRFKHQVCIKSPSATSARTQLALEDSGSASLDFVQSDSVGPTNPACTASSLAADIGINCRLDVLHTITNNVCISAQGDAHQDVDEYCCHDVVSTTAYYPLLALSLPALELVSAERAAGSTGTAGLTKRNSLPTTIFIDFRQPEVFTDNTAIGVAMTAFDESNPSTLQTLNNGANTPTSIFVGGDTIVLRFDVTGIDYDTEPFNKYNIDLTLLEACATEDSGGFPSYEFSLKSSSGCKSIAGVQGAFMVEHYIDAFSDSCHLDRTSASNYANSYCADANTRDVELSDHYLATGRCSISNEACQLPGRAAVNSFSLPACPGAETCQQLYGGLSTTSTGVSDIANTHSSWTQPYCRASGQSTWDLTQAADFPTCAAATAGTTCATAGECGRTASTVYVTFQLPLATFGGAQLESPIYINADVTVTRTVNPVASRRLLSIGDSTGATKESIVVRKGLAFVPSKTADPKTGARSFAVVTEAQAAAGVVPPPAPDASAATTDAGGFLNDIMDRGARAFFSDAGTMGALAMAFVGALVLAAVGVAAVRVHKKNKRRKAQLAHTALLSVEVDANNGGDEEDLSKEDSPA